MQTFNVETSPSTEKCTEAKYCSPRDTMQLHMMFKLGLCAEKRWRKLRVFDYLAKGITGIKCNDGVEVQEIDRNVALFNCLDITIDHSSGQFPVLLTIINA